MKSNDFRGEVWINAHPEIMEACMKANEEPVDGGYGNDSYSLHAIELMQRNFNTKIAATFTISGTAANVMAMKSMLEPWSVILCASQTHSNCYEAGAMEYTLGNKILSIDSPDGKLTPLLLDELLLRTKKYNYNPRVIAFAQPTEFGTVYTCEEIRILCEYAHARGMYVYLDGARIGNAVVRLGTTLKEMIEDTGVDAFSFGGTKAGAMFGEMVVFLREEFGGHLSYLQKQSFQHMSKSKFLAVQLCTILEQKFWLTDARHSNAMAELLEQKLRAKGVEIYYPTQTNTVFAVVEPSLMEKLSQFYVTHYWDEFAHTVRFATTYRTTEEQIDRLVSMF